MKLSKKKVIAFGAFLLVGAAAGYSAVSLNKPAEGTVSQITPVEEKAPEKKAITGKNVSFKYPARFSEASNSNQSASLEYWILVTRLGQGAGQTGQISINITSLPEGGVKEDSAYKNFHAFTDKYKLSDTSIQGDPVVMSTRIDPTYERTALWPHKKLLLTATLTTSVDNEQLNSEFDELMRSVQWQP